MTHVLKVLQLAHQHRMAEMQVGRSGIESRLHAHGLAGGERLLDPLAQVALADDLRRAFAQVGELLVNRREWRHVLDYRSFEFQVSSFKPFVDVFPIGT